MPLKPVVLRPDPVALTVGDVMDILASVPRDYTFEYLDDNYYVAITKLDVDHEAKKVHVDVYD